MSTLRVDTGWFCAQTPSDVKDKELVLKYNF